jgi:uncharacterized protein involved in response to NO
LRIALFGYGFRPFFLAAGIAATLLVPWWAASLVWAVPLGTSWPAALWHGHEMLFGFIVAAIAGFLLTAVPSWTGARGITGWPLALLAVLWVLGRVGVSSAEYFSPPLAAGLDLAFLPALAAFMLPPLVRGRNRNTALLAALTALWATNAAFYWGLDHGNPDLARHALLVGVDIVLLLVTVIGGRIIPAFTTAALKQRGLASAVSVSPGMTPLAVIAMLALIGVDFWRPEGVAAGIVALTAAAIQGMRLAQWGSWCTVRKPIVWVLHLAYLWLPVGLALKALALLGNFAFAAFYLHALTIGAAAMMIVAVMTRASLGHTGRPLSVSPPTVCAYSFLATAALVRVFGPLGSALSYTWVILIAASLWTAAFVIFLFVYAPILLSPRADGKAG